MTQADISAEMQTKDQAPEHPFRRSGLSNSGRSSPHAMLLRKPTNSMAPVRPSSPVPKKTHHIKITPVVQQSPLVNSPPNSTWPEQMENLLSTNIAGTAKERDNIDSGLVVDREFFSKWTLRYHHEAFEKQYHLYRSAVNSKYSFVSVLAGIILNSIFGLIDLLLAPHDLFASHLAITRFGIVVPVAFVILLIVRFLHKKLERWIHLIACVLAGISCAGVLVCACFAHGHIPQSIFTTQYTLVIIYFAALYAILLLSYIIVVAVEGGEMVRALPWGLLAVIGLGGIALVTSYKTEQLARTEWLLITMGERSKRKREKQKETVVGFLGNVLPQKVIQKLKGGHPGTFAEDFPNCTVMFVSLSDFPMLFDHLSPTDLVETLDTVFSGFDDIVEQFAGLEKVKTVGETYMVVGGASEKSHDHAQQIVDCALKMLQMAKKLAVRQGQQNIPLAVRIGVHSGLVHAGLIGWTKMIYDMWGETVNIAGLCTIHGMKDAIQVTNATFTQLHTRNFHSDPSLLSLSPSEPPLSTFILTSNGE